MKTSAPSVSLLLIEKMFICGFSMFADVCLVASVVASIVLKDVVPRLHAIDGLTDVIFGKLRLRDIEAAIETVVRVLLGEYSNVRAAMLISFEPISMLTSSEASSEEAWTFRW